MAPSKLKSHPKHSAKPSNQPTTTSFTSPSSHAYPSINPSPFSISTFETGTPPIAIYAVRPTQIWDSLTRYRECIIEDHPLQIHSDILLTRPSYPSHAGPWYARILEIRGLDAAHVYLRVFWYYTLDQLPAHVVMPRGSGELVASNEMEVVSAQSVIRGVDVMHVHVGGNGGGVSENEGLWWCTKYDFLKGGR